MSEVTLSKKNAPIQFTQMQKVMIIYSMTNILVKELQEVFCLVMGPRGAIHINLQVPGGAFFWWDLS